MRWRVERLSGTASDHHARPWPEPLTRTVWVFDVTSPALVLGSTQRDDVVGATDIEVTRRASGGGAVLVHPGSLVWVDVLLPAGDELWDDDVGNSSCWLGRAWVAALAELGAEATVHAGPMRKTDWSRLVCFAGLAPGEVLAGAAKVVGISQRRRRAGARFQCAALLEPWDAGPLLDLLALDDADRARARQELGDVARGLARLAADVEAAFISTIDRW